LGRHFLLIRTVLSLVVALDVGGVGSLSEVGIPIGDNPPVRRAAV